MKHFVILLVASLLIGCAGPRYASTVQINRDSIHFSTQRLDSLFRAMMQRDSIYQRDSIFLYVKGDTVTKYVERIKYQYKNRTDTIYRNRLLRDTLYIERTDSITIEKPIYIEKQIKWYNQGFIWCGKMCCLAAILWALFLYLKRKF